MNRRRLIIWVLHRKPKKPEGVMLNLSPLNLLLTVGITINGIMKKDFILLVLLEMLSVLSVVNDLPSPRSGGFFLSEAFYIYRSNAKAYFMRWVRKNFPYYQNYDFTVYRYGTLSDMLNSKNLVSSYELVIVD